MTNTNTNPFAHAMSNIIDADTTTQNGLPAFSQTNSAIVDLYYRLVRNIPEQDLHLLLHQAWMVDPLSTVKLIFQSRDCRGGKGDKDPFFVCLNWLAERQLSTVIANIALIPEYGSWMDLVKLMAHPKIGDYAIEAYVNGLKEGNGLAFKYAPRPDYKYDAESRLLRMALGEQKVLRSIKAYRGVQGMSERRYRAFLKAGTKVVESQMCDGKWEEIKYSSVPSIAMKNYGKAFGRHDQERFAEFLVAVKEGKESIKAGQLYPYQLTKTYTEYSEVVEAQWSALLAKGRENISMSNTICLCDTSGSMSCQVSSGLSAMDVAKSLSLYFLSIIPGQWSNLLITFSEEPKFFEFKGETLFAKIQELEAFSQFEGYNTNFIKVFELILDRARQHNLTQEELPERVLVLSDNQFDAAREINDNARRISISSRIKEMFAKSGYTAPTLVYWNLNGRYDNFPATSKEPGIVLISGFSPDGAKALLKGGEVNPAVIVSEILNSERYAPLRV